MFKVILKTTLKSLIIVAVIVLVAFGVASLGFPSEMAGLCERSGNYSLATGYASLSYTYSKDVNDLNRCFADSVFAKNDNDVAKFGDMLIADERAEEVYESNSKTVQTEGGTVITIDYKQYVYGNVSAAKYKLGKKDEALELAKTAMNAEEVQGFPKNNALAILSLRVIESGDKDTAAKLLEEVNKFSPAEEDADYYNALVDELGKVGA